MISNLMSLFILYLTLYMILKSHRITKKEIFSFNAIILYAMLIISYFYIRMPIPSIFIASFIFTIKIISKNPLLIFPSSGLQKLQLLFMTYVLFGMIKAVILNSLNLIGFLLKITNII